MILTKNDAVLRELHRFFYFFVCHELHEFSLIVFLPQIKTIFEDFYEQNF